ncbi:MAG: hypothetical protein JXA78_11845 [Anaerolineales bacterium]|nr:hypothetical protein [Anaerolineales bacterium]
MLRVRLFGPGQADYSGQSLSGFPNQQACLLLCYLLLNKPHPHHRERLASLFWGDNPTQTARKYLRNALWRLRQVFQAAGASPDEYIFVSEENIAFASDSPHWVDVDIFEEAVVACLNVRAAELSQAHIASLEAAVDLYIGDLLEGTYEDWCLYDRERLRLLYLNALNKLMSYHTIQASYPLSLDYGGRLLALDNTQERVHRQMMWLHWRQGDRSAAVAQYKACCQALSEDLGLPPMQATRQLYEKILSGDETPMPDLPAPQTSAGQAALPDGDDAIHPLVKLALRKLRHLQDTLDETRSELKQIERLIYEVIIKSA